MGTRLLHHRVNQKFAVAVVYIASMLMNSIDATIVNVALPTLGREFDVSPAEMESVVIAYLVSLAVFIPVAGWLGDRFGYKRIFLLALTIFTVASALCGLAQSLEQLAFFRILQGAGGGLLTPVGMALLFRTFPPEERISVSRILMVVTIIGPASGPVLGGVIIEHWSWRWIFYVNLPVGLIALIFGLLFLEENFEPKAGRFDIPGFILAGIGFGSFMYALSEGPLKGWTTPAIMASGITGIVVLAIFVRHELRTSEPMIDLRIYSNRLFRRMSTVSFFATGGFLGALFVVPLYLQVGHGFSAMESGLAVFPEAIGVAISAQIVARLYPRVGPRRLMAGGLMIVALSLLSVATLPVVDNVWVFRLNMFALGVGMAYVFLPNQAASMATISRAQTGRASTLFSVQRQIAAAGGVALMSTVLVLVGITSIGSAGIESPNLTAYKAAFAAAAGLALLGSLLAWRIPDDEAAVTMVRRS
jgi:EmrB/QacA subfamily drug resistance transporter